MALTDGLIAKYDLNTNANDSVGSNNGTITGDPVHQTIDGRDVLTFDGNDYVTLPASLNTITDGDYTMSAWVKIPSHNDYPGIVTINGQGILMFQGQVGYMTNGANVVNYVGNSLSTNQWYHVLLTKSSSTYSLYVDSVLKSGSGSDGGWGLSGVTALARGYSTYHFNGSIDDVRIWNRALSASEVTELHAESLALGLIAKYDLNTNANDSVGSNNGTLQGDAAFAADGDRTVLTLDGNGDYVDISNSESMNLSQFTLSTWIKTGDHKNTVLIEKGNSWNADLRYFLHLQDSSTGNTLAYGINTTNWTGVSASSAAVIDNAWHHTVFAYDGSTATLYVDGVQVDQQTGWTMAADTATPVTFGGRSGWSAGTLSGSMDDLRIWNRALSASEVATLHSTTAQLSDNLVKHLKFDGTDTGMTLSGGAALATVDGRSALVLDGSNDYANLGNDTSLDLSSAMTVTAWVKGSASENDDSILISKYVSSNNTRSWGMTTEQSALTGQTTKWKVIITADGTANNMKRYTSSGVIMDGSWHHIAFTFDSGALKLYTDGVEDASPTKTDDDAVASIPINTNPVTVGILSDLTTLPFNGSMDDVRIYNKALTQTEIQSIMTGYDYTAPDTTAPVITVVGPNPVTVASGTTYTDAGATAVDNIDGAVAVVTTGADAISVAADANWNDVTLLLPLDGNATDSSTSGHTLTPQGSVSYDTSDKIFGTASLSVPGSSYLNVPPHSDFNFGTDDFTIELWTKCSQTAHGLVFELNSYHSAIGVMLGINNVGTSGNLWYNLRVGAQLFYIDVNDGTAGTWKHIAIVKESGTVTIFIGGVSMMSKTVGTVDLNGAAFRLGQGVHRTDMPFTGKIDDFRITKGVARYTANFSVPTAAHPTAATGGAIEGTHTVTYTATDAASNVATATRTVNVIVPDTTDPVITLTGNATVTVENGSSYTDAGATATDDTDGDLTSSIVVSGDTVNPNADGAYTIRYNVSDAAGNAATEVTRVVTVVTSSNYATLEDGVNKFNMTLNPNVMGTGVPSDQIGLISTGTGAYIWLNNSLVATGLTIWQKDASHNWTVYDATPQKDMSIPWLNDITALYFQIASISTQSLRAVNITGPLLYDADKTDEDDTAAMLRSAGVDTLRVVPATAPAITTHTVTDWASGAIQTLSVTAGSTPVVMVFEGGVAKFESDYKIDNAATDSVKVTKLSAGTANAKVKIIE